MTEVKKQVNRIPFESLSGAGAVTAWKLPTMDNEGRVIQSAEKEAKNKKKPFENEIIEDYKGRVKPKPMTAEALKQMVDEAQKEGFDEGYREGLNKGLLDGNAKGLVDGRDKAYQETKTRLDDEYQRFAAIAEALLVPMGEQQQLLENIVVDLAVNLAKHLLQAEIQQNPQRLYGIVNSALSALPAGAKNISVHLCASDAELVEQHLPTSHRSWLIKVDNSLAAGGCRVETLDSLVDFSLEARLASYFNQVREQGEVDERAVAELTVDRPAAKAPAQPQSPAPPRQPASAQTPSAQKPAAPQAAAAPQTPVPAQKPATPQTPATAPASASSTKAADDDQQGQ